MCNLKMAACGVDCGECAQYKVTANSDMDAAESLAEWFRSQGWIAESEGADAVMKRVPLCKGCWNITDDCFWKCGCGSIDFRICCKEREIDNCSQCNEFPCKEYKKWVDWHEAHEKAMERLILLRTAPPPV